MNLGEKMLKKSLIYLLSFLIIGSLLGGFGVWFYGTLSLPKTKGSIEIQGISSSVKIIRDAAGIPHIFASTDQDAFFALGYVHSQDRFWQMEMHRRIGAGRLSEIFGEKTLKTDQFLRTLGVYRAASKAWEHLSPPTQRMFESYVAGINGWLAQGHVLPPEFALMGFEPKPWNPIDSLVWAKMMSWDLGADYGKELLRAQLIQALGPERAAWILPENQPGGPTTLGSMLPSSGDLERMLALEDHLDQALGFRGSGVGSNNWVVSGKHTESGFPMLANDPHLATRMPSIWYFAELKGEGFHWFGATLPPLPGFAIGHNDHIAWGVTNLGPDVQDLFLEKIDPQNPNRYLADGEWVDMNIVEEKIHVKGREEPILWAARSTRHGPLISDVQNTASVVALRWTSLDERDTTVEAFFDVSYSRNWEEFVRSLKKYVAPSQNFVYADREGNIGYISPGKIPIRKNGNGMLPVPGWDGNHEWEGWIPFEELPQDYNPEKGYFATANHKPVGPDYPHLIANYWEPSYRAKRLNQLLLEAIASGSVNLDQMKKIQMDQTSSQALEVLPHLRQLQGRNEQERKALKLFHEWNGKLSRDSQTAAIYEAWLHHFERRLFRDDLRDRLFKRMNGRFHPHLVKNVLEIPEQGFLWCDDVRTTPRESCEEQMLEALEEALMFLKEELGEKESDWIWGRLHQTQYPHNPFSQVPYLKFLFHRSIENGGDKYTLNVASHKAANPFSQTHHPSLRMLLDLEDWNRQKIILGTGQSGHLLSPQYDDLMEPHRDGEYFTVSFGNPKMEGETLILNPLP